MIELPIPFGDIHVTYDTMRRITTSLRVADTVSEWLELNDPTHSCRIIESGNWYCVQFHDETLAVAYKLKFMSK